MPMGVRLFPELCNGKIKKKKTYLQAEIGNYMAEDFLKLFQTLISSAKDRVIVESTGNKSAADKKKQQICPFSNSLNF